MPVLVDSRAALEALVGKDLGASEWETMTFEKILKFAEATGDHQWIHVDRERIAKESPFKVPIAHGYLTLSLVAGRFFQFLTLQNFAMVINYGTEKVRFPNPLKEGMRYRLAMKVGEVTPRNEWMEVIFNATIEIEGEAKPACVAQVIYRLLPA